MSVAPTDNQVQTVKFMDSAAHHVAHTDSLNDPVRDYALDSNLELNQFLNRPIKIFSAQWGTGSPFDHQFNPWTAYLQSPSIENRLAHYRLLRGRLHVKFVVSGTTFHYSRVLVDYLPTPNYDSYSVAPLTGGYTLNDITLASQRPHLWLDPSTSKGGELCLPFFWFENNVDITERVWQQLGRVSVHSLFPLVHANGGDSDVTVSAFAWMDDVKFAVPTHKVNSSLSPQAESYQLEPQGETDNPGIVSKTATTVASIARNLVKAPIIGPYAKATEIGARAVGAIGALFGFSRPITKEVDMYRPRTKGNYAVTNAPDDVTKLSVDINQEVTISPSVVDLGTQDELEINYIASRESVLDTFTWTTTNVSETLLWNAVVEPGVVRSSPFAYPGSTSQAIYMPALAYAAAPFSYWRGSIKYRFQIVCSGVHRGRLRVTWDPCSTLALGNDESYTTQQSTVIDIAETKDFTITVGWGQTTSYMNVRSARAQSTPLFGSSAVSYDSSTTRYGNGTISVYCVNELTSTSTEGNNINVIVSVFGGDDIEFAAPTSQEMKNLYPSSFNAVLNPQAESLVNDSTEMGPAGENDVNTYSNPGSKSDNTNEVFFGEKILSFRQMLKRYCTYSFQGYAFSNSNVAYSTIRNMFPTYPGWYEVADKVSIPSGTLAHLLTATTVDDYRYFLYGNPTFLNYCSLGFVGWRGGIRWLVDGTKGTSVRLGNWDTGAIYEQKQTHSLSFASAPAYEKAAIEAVGQNTGLNGLLYEHHTVQNQAGAEVPFYSPFRFMPCRFRQDIQEFDSLLPKIEIIAEGYDVVSSAVSDSYESLVRSHVAAAEDLTFLFYIGPPVLYTYPEIPTTNPAG